MSDDDLEHNVASLSIIPLPGIFDSNLEIYFVYDLYISICVCALHYSTVLYFSLYSTLYCNIPGHAGWRTVGVQTLQRNRRVTHEQRSSRHVVTDIRIRVSEGF